MRPEIQTQDDECCHRQRYTCLWDKVPVIKNAYKSESTLNKKSNAVCNHTVRESAAVGKPLQHTYLVQKNQQTL